MDTTSSEADTQLNQDIRLMGPDIDIVQDVEQDLEDYSRLAKLGRFGEASAFFGEVLSRNLNCYAVLAEHCHALVDQGDFTNAELILSDCLSRQSKSARGPDCFEPEEKQLLRLLLAYVRIYNGHDQRQEEGEALIQARWSGTLINVSSSTELTDVQRQTILICLRIYGAVRIDLNVALEELRLPWSPRPLYPGETITVSNDYQFPCTLFMGINGLPKDISYVLCLQEQCPMFCPTHYYQKPGSQARAHTWSDVLVNISCLESLQYKELLCIDMNMPG